MYKLKPGSADFEVVDGPFAGRKYKAGQVYAEIPAEERHKFDPEFDETNPKSEIQNPKPEDNQ